MNLFEDVTWSEFLSVVLPAYAVIMLAIWFYFDRFYKGSDASMSEASRFAARPLTEDDLPDEDEAFLSADGSDGKSRGCDLLEEIARDADEEAKQRKEREIAEAAKRAEDERRREEGVPEAFDRPQEFDINQDVDDMESEQRLFVEHYMAETCLRVEEDYVETDPSLVNLQEETFITDCSTGADADALMEIFSQAVGDDIAGERKEKLNLAKSVLKKLGNDSEISPALTQAIYSSSEETVSERAIV